MARTRMQGRSVDLFLSDDPDAEFESLIPNLRDQNHFRRLRALQILASFPKRPYVVDHADLDLTGDLEGCAAIGRRSYRSLQYH